MIPNYTSIELSIALMGGKIVKKKKSVSILANMIYSFLMLIFDSAYSWYIASGIRHLKQTTIYIKTKMFSNKN